MNLRAGTKLKSALCSMEAIIIKAPQLEGMLACGGQPVLLAGETGGALGQLAEPQPDSACVGKRYVDEATGLEVLCTKSGKGALSFEGRHLTIKQAKPLPASD